MRLLRFSGVLWGLSFLLLAGCNTIEQRSEVNPKTNLPKISKKVFNPKVVWTNSASRGMGKKDLNLRLSVNEQAVYLADSKGRIVALNRTTGQQNWSIETKTNIASGPQLIGDKLLVGTDDGWVLAYDKENGALLWKVPVSGPVIAAPAGDNKSIFVHALNGSVLALQASNGQEIWRYQVNTPPIMLRQSSSPIVSGRQVLVGFSNGKLIAFDKQDGSINWEHELAISKGRSDLQRMVDVCTDPVVKDNHVYAVSYQGQVAALTLETGASVWEKELSSFSGIAVTDKLIIVSDPKGVVWALNRKSGEVAWKQAELSGRILSQPAITQGFIVVGDEDGYLHWISTIDGSLVSQLSFGGNGLYATPVVKDDILYVLSRNGKIGAIALNLSLDAAKGQ